MTESGPSTNGLEMIENTPIYIDSTEINIEQNENGIQSSVYVNNSSLRADSIDDGVGIPNTLLFNSSKRSSKIRFNDPDEKEKEKTIARCHYGGNMERFFQSEVRPVYFGGNNDALLLLEVTVIASLLVNLFEIFVYMQYDDLIPQKPSEHHPHNALLRLLPAFESALSAYYSDGQIVVGWMLVCWFLGYNVISGVIWWQFERREVRSPDDYEIIPSNRLRRRTGSNADNSTNPINNNAIEIGDRLISRDSFRKLTKAQKLQNQNQNQNHSQNQSDPFNSSFDKSVVVISMPNGDFAVGKRQKLFFN